MIQDFVDAEDVLDRSSVERETRNGPSPNSPLELGHFSIQITLDFYGHLFNDAELNRQQVDLLETDLYSVRK